MKYTLVGVKTCPITQNIQSTMELSFNSYTEARMNQITLELEHYDTKFHIDFNANYESLESLMIIISKDSSLLPSNYN